jgi:hypothetical protein
MSEKAETYFSYLLRLWREDRNDERIWRASLESAQTGEQHNFNTLSDLFGFLCERAGVPGKSCEESQQCRTNRGKQR